VILKVLSQIRPSCSPVFGEALAAQLASDLASFMKLDQVIIEGDISSYFLFTKSIGILILLLRIQAFQPPLCGRLKKLTEVLLCGI
jgi:hypothetical protein